MMEIEVRITVELPDEPPDRQLLRINSLARQFQPGTEFRSVMPRARGWLGYAAAIWQVHECSQPTQSASAYALRRSTALQTVESRHAATA